MRNFIGRLIHKGNRESDSTQRPGQSVFRTNWEKRISFFDKPIANTIPRKKITLFELYELIRSNTYRDIIQRLRKSQHKDSKVRIKANELDYVTISGTFKNRSENQLTKHSGLLVLDLDDIDNVHEVKSQLRDDPYTIMVFISPGGDGLKWIVPVSSDPDWHRTYFLRYVKYTRKEYGLQVDESGKDVARACFLSYDPDAYLNPRFLEGHNIEPIEVGSILRSNNNTKGPNGSHQRTRIEPGSYTLKKIDHYISKLEQKEIDVTQDYNDWVMIGFSLASLGEAGRNFYHRVSAMHPEYSEMSCDYKFDNLQQSLDPDKATIESFFKSIKTFLPDESNDEYPRYDDNVYTNLPRFFQDLTNRFEDPVEKDMVLLGALTIASGCLPNYRGIYHRRSVSSNIYTMIIAPAGTGKGVLGWAETLGRCIHNSLKRNWDLLTEEQRKSETERKSLFISSNASSSAFLEDLYFNNGKGIIFSSEIDSLTNTLNQEWGDFSSYLRQAFHHETISLRRKTDKLDVEITDPELSVLLSGTPNQLTRLIDNVEDGLCSRFLFHYTQGLPEFADVFKDSSDALKDAVDLMGEKLYILFGKFQQSSETVKFKLSEEFEEKFLKYYRDALPLYHSFYGMQFGSIIKRMALVHYKLCMILSALEYINEPNIPDNIRCSPRNFECAHSIIKQAIKGAEIALQYIPKSPKQRTLKQKRLSLLYERLPIEFSKSQAESVAVELNIPPASLTRLLNDNAFDRKSHGTYKKKYLIN